MKSYKTTIAGVLTIVAALANAGLALSNGHMPDITVTSAALSTGVGLILAADHSNLPPRP
jgi:hypothetical protein